MCPSKNQWLLVINRDCLFSRKINTFKYFEFSVELKVNYQGDSTMYDALTLFFMIKAICQILICKPYFLSKKMCGRVEAPGFDFCCKFLVQFWTSWNEIDKWKFLQSLAEKEGSKRTKFHSMLSIFSSLDQMDCTLFVQRACNPPLSLFCI